MARDERRWAQEARSLALSTLEKRQREESKIVVDAGDPPYSEVWIENFHACASHRSKQYRRYSSQNPSLKRSPTSEKFVWVKAYLAEVAKEKATTVLRVLIGIFSIVSTWCSIFLRTNIFANFLGQVVYSFPALKLRHMNNLTPCCLELVSYERL